MYYTDQLQTCCGVIEVGEFGDRYGTDVDGVKKSVNKGTGLAVAAFIDTPNCKKAYDELTKELTLLYQSPLKKNRNSGRQLFLCVFVTKGR